MENPRFPARSDILTMRAHAPGPRPIAVAGRGTQPEPNWPRPCGARHVLRFLAGQEDGSHQRWRLPVHSFETPPRELATRCRNIRSIAAESSSATFQHLTDPTPLQARAFQLLRL